MVSRGWEVTTSRSRQVSRGRPPTSSLLSRCLRAQPRAPTCSPARRHNRYQTSSQQIRLDPLCCCPESGDKHQRYIQIQKKKKHKVIIFMGLLAAPDSSDLSLKNGRVAFLDDQALCYFCEKIHPFRHIHDTPQT